MLVIYDNTGFVNQAILQADCELEMLSQRYDEMGVPNLLYEGEGDIFNLYVDVTTTPHRALQKPPIAIAGENRPVKADGIDTLEFQLEPMNANVMVTFHGQVVHQEDLTDGKIEFAVDQAGTYELRIEAAFPYAAAVVTIEAVE